jgi:ribosomal protein S18 acetylase RimI-like enzyme
MTFGQLRGADDVLVRPYALEDKPRLLTFIRHVWSYKPDVEAQFNNRWWWSASPPPLLVAENPVSNAIVGMCAFMPFTLRAHGQDLPSAWFVDFYVLPEYQGQGLGRRLTERVQNAFSVTASLSQTAMAYRVFARMGWSARALVRLHMHPLPMRWLFPSGKGTLRMSGPNATEPPARLDLDRLWNRVGQGYDLIAARNGDALLNRYATDSHRRYAWVTCYRNNECAGYIVVRTVRSHGLVVDFLVQRGDREAFSALLSEGVRALIESGAERIYCLSTDPEWERLLRLRGFLSSVTPILGPRLASQNKWLTYRTDSASLTLDATGWYLTLGDCDLDLAW